MLVSLLTLPSRRGFGILIAVVAVALGSAAAGLHGSGAAQADESSSAVSPGVHADDGVSPWVEYLNAVGVAAAAAEPAESTIAVRLAGATPAAGAHEHPSR